MKRVRFQRPKLSTMSPMPTTFALASTVRTMNDVVAHLPDRVRRGRHLFLLMMAGMLLERLQARNPEVRVNGEERRYAEDLRIAVVTGASEDEDVLAIYLDSESGPLADDARERTALYVLPRRNAPKWAAVLGHWGPWPANMLPMPVTRRDARVIARNARPDEIRALTERLNRNREDILRDLNDAGADNAQWGRAENAVGTHVHQDLAHAVLRREFGLDGEQPRAHWRPALREVVNAVPDAIARFNRYLVTGRESAFVLPDVGDQITIGQLHAGTPFVRELAPFVPNR